MALTVIAKIQMPIDMTKARQTGLMFVDESQKPNVLVYDRNRKGLVVDNEKVWDKMMELNLVKGFFRLTVDNDVWAIVEQIEDQSW